MKKSILSLIVVVMVVSFLPMQAAALSYDENKYYWDCEEDWVEVDDINKCLKERVIPLNYYPYIGGVIVLVLGIIGRQLYIRRREK
ncbi:hypothetical protein [Fredinandcohnia sp. 179-A 10B2 NHS]|uniref:hypothetical protein n=1 Tax=Fredinandcohnia sp. 179-A 10B2 NHS TaxID=3235176 RepID=UPI00399FA81E